MRFGVIIRSMWHQSVGRFALIVMACWIAVSLLSLFWTPYPLLYTDGGHAWAAPSAAHPLGTDGVGADVLSWLMAGSRTNLVIALLTMLVSAVIGLACTAVMISGRRALASAGVVVVDALIAIPTVLLALLFAVPFGTSISVIVAACGMTYGLNMARIVKPSASLAARSAYVEAARAMGGERVARVFSPISCPRLSPVLAVQLSMSAGTSILAEAGLTYLGVGVPSGVPSWGHTLTTSVRLISVYPLTVLWPGLTVTLVVTALYLLGDTIRDCADPLANVELRKLAAAVGRQTHNTGADA
ncbi:peptide transporter of ABC superfamily, permease OppC [Bifidobacterium thermophilum]|nr:peptide transporter of ABC superfamily, permease OppC [Bifidobacterium thermophilum]